MSRLSFWKNCDLGSKRHGKRIILSSLMLFPGCTGSQSALDPAGTSAEKIAEMFWWMTAGVGVIWSGMVALTLYSVYFTSDRLQRNSIWLIIGGGTVIPTIVLLFLLVYGLAMMPEMLAPAPEGSLKIAVTGEQWWWRIRYETSDGEPLELANEIHLPVGEPVDFQLRSADVLHSFWIPSLGGKVDMIPGRQTRLKLQPTRTGLFRGACAEYCGTSHALMQFMVVVSPKREFEEWLHRQREPAQLPAESLASSGRDVFQTYGCGACHTVRGTTATGRVGPDLTHVGSRKSLGAGILSNSEGDFLRWIKQTAALKPDVHMPSFNMLPENDLIALSTYLDSLE